MMRERIKLTFQDMLTKAESIKIKMNVINVRFVDSKITDIPALSSGSVDCIISNCVVNLVPDEEKPLVFQEMHRLLKSGGRVAVSDILAKGPLPAHIRESMALYVGCIAGASQKDEYEKWLKEAGFRGILLDAES
jgi:ubiquinone/menaquinone biosynthesis C-methylase UbiE